MNRLLLLLCAAISLSPVRGQSKSIEAYVAEAATHFTIDPDMSANGVAFFDSLFRTHHFFVLGEYHGSSQISRLTRELIPLYAGQGGKLFGLEIGPIASQLLRRGLEREPAAELLGGWNGRYGLEAGGRVFTPLPFFKTGLDAGFLQTAFDHHLIPVGLDQEYLFSYPLLLDNLTERIPPPDTRHRRLAAALRDTVGSYLELERDYLNRSGSKEDRLPLRFERSEFVRQALDTLEHVNTETRAIVRSIRASHTIYYHNAIGDWWNSNRLRTEHFLTTFRSTFLPRGLPTDERLLLKIGGLHAARGMNAYYRYDMGNMIYEFARLTGRRSVHLIVLDRYWLDEAGDVRDNLEDSTSWIATNFTQFLSVGKPEQWTIIELDKIRKAGLYLEGVHESVRKYFERYDVVLIPPADREAAVLADE